MLIVILAALGILTAAAASVDDPVIFSLDRSGLKLDGQGWGELGGTRALIGTLSNSQGVMIKLVGLDPYAHWNYKPAAADAWAFLSRYRRDLTTGKLVVARGK